MTTKILGLLLNAAGVAVLWFGGVPYKEKQTVLDVGVLKAEATVEKKMEIPQPVGATLVGVGSVLLMIPGGRRRKD
jgi:hypothetical protein